jgi:hypothetical protein
MLASLAIVGSGCWRVRQEQAPPLENWPRQTPPGLVAIETRPRHTGCTGAVVHNAGGFAYVLTAGHCVQHKPEYVAVVRPEGRPQGVFWWRHQVTRVLSAAEPKVVAEEEQTTWGSDWAILEMRTAQVLPIIPLLEVDRAESLPIGETVALETFFDYPVQSLYAHAHYYGWREFCPALLLRGHSGAPVLWQGQIVAVFSGATTTFSVLHLSRWPDRLELTQADTVRRQAAACGLSLDTEGSAPTAPTPACRLLVPLTDPG